MQAVISFMRTLLRDRLIWFVLIGGALFAAEWAWQQRQNKVILIDLPLVEKLAVQWQAQTKSPPNASQLDALIEGYVREEILVREAARLGLDQQDVIIRRRLAQKVEFFLGDVEPPQSPDEAGLKEYFDENIERYSQPEKVSFQHIFANKQVEAAALLTQLGEGEANWRLLGQPFMLNREYAGQSQTDLLQLMGRRFTDAVFAQAQLGAWFGPVRSAYGWHVVKLTARSQKQVPEFASMIEKVANDWHVEQARNAQQAAWEKLRQDYRVEMVPLEGER